MSCFSEALAGSSMEMFLAIDDDDDDDGDDGDDDDDDDDPCFLYCYILFFIVMDLFVWFSMLTMLCYSDFDCFSINIQYTGSNTNIDILRL